MTEPEPEPSRVLEAATLVLTGRCPFNYTSSDFTTVGGTFLVFLKVCFRFLLLTAMCWFMYLFSQITIRTNVGNVFDNIYVRIYFVPCLRRLRSLRRQTESSSDFPAVCPLTQQALNFHLAYTPCCFFEIVPYLLFILSSFLTVEFFHHCDAELRSQSNVLAPWKQRAFADRHLPSAPFTKRMERQAQKRPERPL